MLWRKRSEDPAKKSVGGTQPTNPPIASGASPHGDDASDRTLAACADILAWCGTAISEISDSAAPFLTIQERASLRAQGTNFQSLGYQSSAIIEQPVAALAPAPVIQEATTQVAADMLSRDEVETIVSHRVEIAVQDTLAKLGVAPGSSIRDEVERQVEVQLATQEHRLLEYVKRHLTDSLKVLEVSLSERLGEVLEDKSELAEAKAEVDAQVEGAREALLRQIEEVRTVNVGFNIESYAAELAGVASVEIAEDEESILEDEEIVLGGEEIEIDLGEEDVAAAAPAPATPSAPKVPQLTSEEKAAAKKRASEEKAAAKKRASEEKAAAKKRASEEKAAAKKAAAEKAAAEKAAAEKAAAEKAAAEKAAAEKAAAEKAAAEKAAAEKAAAEKAAADANTVEEEDLQISLMPAPGQDMAEIYLNKTTGAADGDSRESDGISLDLDIDEDSGLEEQTSAREIEAALEHYIEEGDRAMRKNRFDGAVTSYDSAINVAPDNGALYLKRGLAYKAGGQAKKAFLDLMKARDLEPSLPDIRKHLTETRKAVAEADAAAKGAKKS